MNTYVSPFWVCLCQESFFINSHLQGLYPMRMTAEMTQMKLDVVLPVSLKQQFPNCEAGPTSVGVDNEGKNMEWN